MSENFFRTFLSQIISSLKVLFNHESFVYFTVVNFISIDDERLASLIQQYSESGESLDKLFSRRRGLSRALKN